MIDPGPLPLTPDFFGRMRMLSASEFGLLVRMLGEQWQAGCLPSDTARLERHFGGDEFRASWPAIRHYFTRDPDGGTMRQLYMDGVREQAMERIAKSRGQRVAAAIARWGNKASGRISDRIAEARSAANALAYPFAHAGEHAAAYPPAQPAAMLPQSGPHSPAGDHTGTRTHEGAHAQAGGQGRSLSPVPVEKSIEGEKKKGGRGKKRPHFTGEFDQRKADFVAMVEKHNARDMVASPVVLRKFVLHFTQRLETPDGPAMLWETRMPFDVAAALEKWVLNERAPAPAAKEPARSPDAEPDPASNAHSRSLE